MSCWNKKLQNCSGALKHASQHADTNNLKNVIWILNFIEKHKVVHAVGFKVM